ncbi:MAG TPA: YggS family pyridoxal phosphate-dependent enzyme [Lachnospiraceae bacterium]|nr:YggS family pyridoxal phosphate-dependent enzyme [Lachnospiraceae bacterium]
MLTDNLDRVKERIADACRRSGRDPSKVTLVAVSKTKPEADILELYKAGQRDFGENYIQELRKKHDDLPKDIRWHMIGHLQRNKVKYIAEYVNIIHSVDTFELAQTIEKEAAKYNRVIPVLIEVNAAEEESKFGVKCKDASALAEKISTLPHVSLKGFMTSAPLVDNPEDDRIYFKKLSNLSVDINSKNYNNVTVDVLSMGMSNDFEVAVEEGSTMVRVGTCIFGKRDYSNS